MTTSSTFSLNPLGYEGIDLNTVSIVLTPANRIPTTNDIQPYGAIWPYIGTSPATLYISEGAGNWGLYTIPSGDLVGLAGNAGAATPAANSITISGGTTGLTTTASGHTVALTGTLGVPNGGTGVATLTAHGVLIGEGAGNIVPLAAAATGTVLMGVTGADPAFTGSPSFLGTVTAATGITSTAGNIVATAGNISTTAGSITSATTLTATLGAITATNGNLVLGTTGNKLVIHATTAASDSIGTSVAMTAGAVVISTTAVTASSIIFLTMNTPGGTPGYLSYGSINPGVGFRINSTSATDTSTVNYLIIN